MKNLTLDILAKENPELLAQIQNAAKDDGAKAERQRIKDIEDLAIQGHSELVQKAKFEDIMNADTLAGKVLKAEKETRTNYLKNSSQDAEVLNSVASIDTTNPGDKSNDYAANIAASMDSINSNKIR